MSVKMSDAVRTAMLYRAFCIPAHLLSEPEYVAAPINVPRRLTREPVKAWRAWNAVYVKEHGWILRSVYFTQHLWYGPVLHADHAPSESNVHGVHAFLRTYPHAEHSVVQGELTLWGKVAAHEWGYRAQHARINRLTLSPCIVLPVHMRRDYAPEDACLKPAYKRDWFSNAEDAPLEEIAWDLERRYQCEVEILTEAPEDIGKEIMAAYNAQLREERRQRANEEYEWLRSETMTTMDIKSLPIGSCLPVYPQPQLFYYTPETL
jgi:hypothetical protein